MRTLARPLVLIITMLSLFGQPESARAQKSDTPNCCKQEIKRFDRRALWRLFRQLVGGPQEETLCAATPLCTDILNSYAPSGRGQMCRSGEPTMSFVTFHL